jgi:hypothetical protein
LPDLMSREVEESMHKLEVEKKKVEEERAQVEGQPTAQKQ